MENLLKVFVMEQNQFEGLEEVLDSIDSLADLEGLPSALGKACAVVEASAKQKAPKDTGALARSITSKIEDTEGIIFTPLEYAPYVEYGTGLFAENGNGRKTGWAYKDEKTGETIWTRGQHPQPYMRPALNENRQKVVELIKEGLIHD